MLDDDQAEPAPAEPAPPVDEFSFGWGDDGRLRGRFDVGAGLGAVIDKALRAARNRLYRERTGTDADDVHGARVDDIGWVDALERLAHAALAGLDPATAAGQRPGDRYQVLLHVDLDHPERSRLHLGPLLPVALRRELTCDADIRAVLWQDGRPVGLGRRRRVADPMLRALIEDRDDGCRICGRRGWLHIHHLVHWEDDGPTDPDNLVALCTACHRAVHAGRLRLIGDPTTTRRPPHPRPAKDDHPHNPRPTPSGPCPRTPSPTPDPTAAADGELTPSPSTSTATTPPSPTSDRRRSSRSRLRSSRLVPVDRTQLLHAPIPAVCDEAAGSSADGRLPGVGDGARGAPACRGDWPGRGSGAAPGRRSPSGSRALAPPAGHGQTDDPCCPSISFRTRDRRRVSLALAPPAGRRQSDDLLLGGGAPDPRSGSLALARRPVTGGRRGRGAPHPSPSAADATQPWRRGAPSRGDCQHDRVPRRRRAR